MLTLLVGDVREKCREIPRKSIHCVVTSPPYWGLRDYGTGTWEGGDPFCDHVPPSNRARAPREMRNGRGESHESSNQAWAGGSERSAARFVCECGARRIDRQIGSESTPEEFVTTMVEVFREVREVLRDDGTLWLNLGDKYVSSGSGGQGKGDREGREYTADHVRNTISAGLKNKDLLGIPWRVALALQADGWYLRQDVIWHKPSPMPESVDDRCTRAHEYIFMLTKQERYFYDALAIAEDCEREPHARGGVHRPEQVAGPMDRGGHSQYDAAAQDRVCGGDKRNARSVWRMVAEPYKGAHFATFPSKLPERCILAGTSAVGCCAACGAPRKRVTEREQVKRDRPNDYTKRTGEDGTGNSCANSVAGVRVETIGWEPSCECSGEFVDATEDRIDPETMKNTRRKIKVRKYVGGADSPVPCTVLDPFFGAGTTGLAAIRAGRRAVGIELNPEYAAMATKRLTDQFGLLL